MLWKSQVNELVRKSSWNEQIVSNLHEMPIEKVAGLDTDLFLTTLASYYNDAL